MRQRCRRCDWGLGYEEGIELLLPHAQASRTLATLACLRARIRFEDGHIDQALEDILDAMTLGRHVSRDGSLITVLLELRHRIPRGRNARALPAEAEREVLKNLKTRLAALPPGESPAEGMVFEEKAGLDWLILKMKEQKDKESMQAFASSFCSRQGDSPEQNSESGRAVRRRVRWHGGGHGQAGGRDPACLSVGGEVAGTATGSV